MSRITLIGGSSDRFVLADGTEGYLEVKKDPTDKQAERGTPIAVVFVPDHREPAPELDEPGHDVTAGHPDYPRERAEKQAKLDEAREKREAAEAKAKLAADRKANPPKKEPAPEKTHVSAKPTAHPEKKA